MQQALKLLIVRLSSIGDIVLTTPVLRCLKKQFPQHQLHYLTKPQFTPILSPNPYLQEVHAWQNKLSQTLALLRPHRFNHIIDLHNNQRTLLLKMALGITAHSFNKINLQKWLAVNLKLKSRLPQTHIVDRYLETLRFLGVENDGQGLDYFISPDDEVTITSLFSNITQPYVAMAIGAAHATKRLPKHKLLTICEMIKQPLVLLGGKEDRATGNYIVEKLNTPVYNACGLLRLGQSASVIQQSAKVISPDTGLMHIAAAFNKPIMSIWGNTLPQFGMYPYLPENTPNNYVVAEVKGLPCRPCSKIGYEQCPKKHFRCMELIDENEIADWANEV